MKPEFSVIIPTLNEEKYLPHLLDSLAAQTKKNFEVVVVDGSSRDKTVAEANKFKNRIPCLKVIISKTASLPLQRNLGARASTGEWLVFIDADSVMMPYFFERVSSYIRKNETELLTSWCRPDSEKNGDATITLLSNIIFEASISLKRPFTPGPMTIVARRAYDLVGGYDEEHAFNEDVDFGLRLHKAGIQLKIIRETLWVWSMRRLRQKTKLKLFNQYVRSVFPVLFFRTTLKRMPDYMMGGHLYQIDKVPKKSVLKVYETKLKKLINELVG
jgi:glycosyltransferase involved in cell wall biosynthesis